MVRLASLMTGIDDAPADGHRVRLTADEALVNLRIVLDLCAAGKLRCSDKTGRPSAATSKALASQLVHGDFYPDEPIASFAWPLILQAGGLAKVENGKLLLTAKGRSALRQPPHQVIRGLWQRWLSHALLDEFRRIEVIKGQQAINVLTAARPRREAVSRTLAGCPAHEWISVEALFSLMRRRGLSPTMVRSELAIWKLHLEDAQYGSFGYDGAYSWTMVEGRYTLVVLFEYAATLGLIDVEYDPPAHARDDFRENRGADDLDALSRYDGLRAVRLNPLGCYVLGLGDDSQLPDTFTEALDDVAQLVDLGHARVIECADPNVITLIAKDRALRGVVRRLGDHHLAVPVESERKFETALRRLGYVIPAAVKGTLGP